jgi:hypothetical protein
MPSPKPGRQPDEMDGVVDRLLAQLPGLQGQWDAPRSGSRPPVVVSSPAFIPTTIASPGPGGGLRAWARVVLALTLAITLVWWPYLHSCGFPLFGYLGAVATVIWAGAWAAVSAWKRRIGLAHTVSLIVVLYGIVLGVAELLPRTGYAVDQATWRCQSAVTVFTAAR